MEVEKNVWQPLEVQGIVLGDFIHVFKQQDKENYEYLNSKTWLVRKVTEVEDYVCVALRSENIGVYVPQLVIKTPVFERLYKNKFTTVTDYFLLAQNCISVYGEEGTYISYGEDENRECYHFRAKMPDGSDIKFWFVIDFSLQ